MSEERKWHRCEDLLPIDHKMVVVRRVSLLGESRFFAKRGYSNDTDWYASKGLLKIRLSDEWRYVDIDKEQS